MFRLFKVFRVFRVSVWGSRGLVVGFNFGFGRTKTTRNVTWGSILTPCQKKTKLKTAENLKLDKNRAKCNMGSGRKTKIYPVSLSPFALPSPVFPSLPLTSSFSTASQADLQMALDVVHAWGVSPLVLAPPNPPIWSSVLCAAALTAVFTSVAFPCPWFSSTGIWALSSPPTLSWRPHVEFLCSRGDRLFHQTSAWCLGEGLPLSFSSSVFVSRVLLLVFRSLLTILLPFRNSTSHSVAGAATFSDGPALPVLQYWELGIGDALHLAHGRAFLAFRALVCCRPRLSSPSGHCQCVPALLVCMVTLVCFCPALLLHPAPCPRG